MSKDIRFKKISYAKDVVERISSIATNPSLNLSQMYSATCSQIAALWSRKKVSHLTVTDKSLEELDDALGMRIFIGNVERTQERTKERSKERTKERTRENIEKIQPCKLRKSLISSSTCDDVKAFIRENKIDGAETFIGNWALMSRSLESLESRQSRSLESRSTRSTRQIDVPVIGFYNCRERRVQGPERLVKHINLCVATRRHFECRENRESSECRVDYIFSGTFVAIVEKKRVHVHLDCNSGSWSMAKRLLRMTRVLNAYDTDARVNAAVIKRVSDPITKLVRSVLKKRLEL